MSGGNCPETPRQKMIGMMYLFLTAMLALNVSGELLQAFVTLDEGFNQSRGTVERKSEALYVQFENAFKNNQKKAGDDWKKANDIKLAADSLVGHIQNLKIILAHTAGGPEATPDKYTGMDNVDVAPQIMIVEKGGERSALLKSEMGKFKELLVSFLDKNDPADSAFILAYEEMFNTDPIKGEKDVEKSWQSTKFEHIPLSASMAMLSKIQGDVRSAEADMVTNLYANINKDSYKFDRLASVVKPYKTTILEGETYTAELFMAAYDPTIIPTIIVDGKRIDDIIDGKGILKQTRGVGEYKWKGYIEMPSPDGSEYIKYPIEDEYQVVKPNAVISPIKMNVFYEGVDNPVAISVPGVASRDLRISMSNVKHRMSGANYIVTPNPGTAGKQSVVSVNAQLDGKNKFIGQQEFRIKRVPDPVPVVAGQTGGKIGKSILVAQAAVFAEMKDFDFELKYDITRFSISVIKNGYSVDERSESGRITEQQKELIKGMGPGSKVSFEGIRAKGPGGDTRDLGTMTFVLD